MRDLALFQAARLMPIEAGAARSSSLRRNSGCAGTATGSLPTARATVRNAQAQFCRFDGGNVAAPCTRVIRWAKVGRVGSAKAFRDSDVLAIGCLMMTGGETRYFSLERQPLKSA